MNNINQKDPKDGRKDGRTKGEAEADGQTGPRIFLSGHIFVVVFLSCHLPLDDSVCHFLRRLNCFVANVNVNVRECSNTREYVNMRKCE